MLPPKTDRTVRRFLAMADGRGRMTDKPEVDCHCQAITLIEVGGLVNECN
jgi:hypothetical protein